MVVPTKGRAGRITEAVLALSPHLLVEVEEQSAYRDPYGSLPIHVHPQSNRGVSYARNQALYLARKKGWRWFWLCDDDLSEFGTRVGPVLSPGEPVQTLLACQQLIESEPWVGLAAPPAAWAACPAGGITWNHCLYSCVAIHVPATVGLAYREELKLKEDLDFTLQVVARGWRAGRLDDFYFQMPHPGTSAGGLMTTYATDGMEAAMAQQLVNLWPGVVSARPGVKREKVDWDQVQRALVPREPVSAPPPPIIPVGGGFRPRARSSR